MAILERVDQRKRCCQVLCMAKSTGVARSIHERWGDERWRRFFMSQTRKIITSVAFMRAAAVCPRFRCISIPCGPLQIWLGYPLDPVVFVASRWVRGGEVDVDLKVRAVLVGVSPVEALR